MMSAPQAVAILMGMMRDETLGVDSINAISMGVVQIMHHYRSRMRNYARRYAAAMPPNEEVKAKSEEVNAAVA